MKFFIFAKSFFKVFLNRRNFSSKIFGGFRHVSVLRNDSIPFLGFYFERNNKSFQLPRHIWEFESKIRFTV